MPNQISQLVGIAKAWSKAPVNQGIIHTDVSEKAPCLSLSPIMYCLQAHRQEWAQLHSAWQCQEKAEEIDSLVNSGCHKWKWVTKGGRLVSRVPEVTHTCLLHLHWGDEGGLIRSPPGWGNIHQTGRGGALGDYGTLRKGDSGGWLCQARQASWPLLGACPQVGTYREVRTSCRPKKQTGRRIAVRGAARRG